ncbi:MAG: DUF2358 domain-containing protein [Roseofilum sp. SBFL]|uniref:DUF2358 domain-containing protein n=1 Tax=unclassified Roseofilum TaxID=2620099 RepID=UPI001B2A5581|nr:MULTISPECIES: DUF2358 domain-containing protein [unclassified Roseofilum]MBP0012223.1 DUF2358 domain-containing protein [Roseofilum sp. SID3]MBP0026470.1 DUF2358 domain-containing protein [Roseofilum sp. SID2]MBP0039874.1 DUF2358 domain-containing protein [Roseofilum sp. SID1]MBP0041628.1 DUF2358 domain-containing protein [Roseofilum sp. SBFL]
MNSESVLSTNSDALPPQIKEVMEILQQDLPTLFQQDINYNIYTPDILFEDPISQFKGKLNYRIIFWTLRFHGQLFFTELFFDVHQMHFLPPETLRVDWTVRGKLRVPWKAEINFNGYSTYTFNDQALIDRHVDTWDRPPLKILKQFLPRSTSTQVK